MCELIPAFKSRSMSGQNVANAVANMTTKITTKMSRPAHIPDYYMRPLSVLLSSRAPETNVVQRNVAIEASGACSAATKMLRPFHVPDVSNRENT